MRIRIFTAVATTMLASLALASAPASAKTATACKKEWQADKAAMQAAGKTEAAYIAECRTPAAKPSTAAATQTKYPKEDKGGY